MLNCLPVAFYSIEIFERVSETMIAHEIAMLKKALNRRTELEAS